MKILKTEARELRDEIAAIVREIPKDIVEGKLKVVVKIKEDWFYKNGEVKRSDVSNREKFLIDSVFKALNIDDRFIFEQTFIKEQNFHEGAEIEIWNLT